jgi:acetyl-CoA C-acetyltransferase
MQITIAGHHTTKVGELWEKGLADLFQEAIGGSVKNAGIDSRQIDQVFVASKAPGEFNNQLHLNALVSQFFNHFPPSMRVEGACASGGLALLAAEQAILSGYCQTALVVGAEKMTDTTASNATRILAMAANHDAENGSTFPGLYALLAQVHTEKFKTSREMLSAVAVKNHTHALENPLAQFHREFTLDQVSQSPLVADPLRLLDCSPISDGASAVILTGRKMKNKPKILGFGHAQDALDLASRKDLTTLRATVQAAQKSYQMADVRPDQIQLAEVHDCFTIAEILAIEDLGFFDKGMGGRATLNHETKLNGKVVINLSGGLKAFGHPIGATGIKQVVYLAQQIEDERYKLGLAHNVGGSGATAVVHVVG